MYFYVIYYLQISSFHSNFAVNYFNILFYF